MRRRDHLWQRLQPVIDRGFPFEHVQRGAPDMTRLDGVGHRLLVDEVAAGRVDNSNALLRAREPLGVHEVAGLFVGGHVERQVVGTCEHLVERH